MEHSTEVTSTLTANEPPNGTKLIVDMGGEWKVIHRDDAAGIEAYGPDDPHKQRWIEDEDDDPMALHEHVKYADAVYALGAPLAVFRQ